MPPPDPLRARPPAAPVLDADLEAVAAGDGALDEEATVEAAALAGAARPELHARFLTLSGCRVTASLAGARLPDATLRDCVFETADLANLQAPRSSIQRSVLRGARLTGATLAEASLRDVTLTGCRADLVSFAAARLERVVLEDCDLGEAIFEEAVLRDVRIERCRLEGASFARASLQRVELVGCELRGVRDVAALRGASLPWPDVVANAGALAGAAGFAVLSDDD